MALDSAERQNWFSSFRHRQRSPLARRIIAFNLVGLSLLVAGILYLSQFRETAAEVRRGQLVVEATLIAEALGAEAMDNSVIRLDEPALLALGRNLAGSTDAYAGFYSVSGNPLGVDTGIASAPPTPQERTNSMSDILADAQAKILALFQGRTQPQVNAPTQSELHAAMAIRAVTSHSVRSVVANNEYDQVIISAAVPVMNGRLPIGSVVLSTPAGDIDAVLRTERLEILQVFALAIVISVALSYGLARTIARPLEDLAAAAELGSVQKTGKLNPGRIHIPDMSSRPDEIGDLSRQMRAMTAALYDRIEANESFAADVVHELKNPLTSLNSAVETLGYAKTDRDRERLMEVISQDVHRMDRLITDISNASRLDAELAKDDMEVMDLRDLLRNVVSYQAELAKKVGVKIRLAVPEKPIMISVLENRLAQVFVNLISNAVSFVPAGGDVTVRAEERGSEVVRVSIEDTGPGIPEENLNDIFKRFYSSRPEQQFGNNSGLGLSISRQIVEAHGGAIWAENIRAEGEGADAPSRGARFIIELPA